MAKVKRGGARKGSGRKQKYGERTVVVSNKCPESKVKVFKNKTSEILTQWEK